MKNKCMTGLQVVTLSTIAALLGPWAITQIAKGVKYVAWDIAYRAGKADSFSDIEQARHDGYADCLKRHNLEFSWVDINPSPEAIKAAHEHSEKDFRK